MLRTLHSLAGIWAAVLVLVLALSGAALSLSPSIERVATPLPSPGLVNVAQLAHNVKARYPGATQIQRTPNGAIIVFFEDGEGTGAEQIDPFTGNKIATYEQARWLPGIKNLHRSLLLGSEGRLASGLGAVLMAILCISGAFMLADRLGGWRNLFLPVRGTATQRWHCRLGRAAIVGLLLSSTSGIYLSALTLGILPEAQEAEAPYPENSSDAGQALPVLDLPALQGVDVNELRELLFPYQGDPSDHFSLLTTQGAGYVSPFTGRFAVPFQQHEATYRLYETIYQWHTGEGLWWLGLLLGISALSVPVLVVTGVKIWWKRRSARPKLANNSSASSAKTIILVGSESNTTWGFAKTLHDALVQAGHTVHTAAMNQLGKYYRNAEQIFILTATYGDGGPPASGNQFFTRLESFEGEPWIRYSVLGFGDRQFPAFCQFALEVDAALQAKGWTPLLPIELIDRQSTQEFERWGTAIGDALGLSLSLIHQPERPRTIPLRLVEKIAYGVDLQEPVAVLRFAVPEKVTWRSRLPDFEAGDLVGILAPGSPIPRYYSLASSATDGVVEICVRKHPNGLCSGYLHGLKQGDRIDAFIKPNPHFRLARSKAPVILIGAGTGIGPLTGFIRKNAPGHPMYLYWGGRNPQTDFLYKPELCQYLNDRRLTGLKTAFSRDDHKAYVQDRLIADEAELRKLVEDGAQILVCGSRAMAASVANAINAILAPMNLSVQTLKAQGRFREDVF